jgi:tetratricopeptide repeat protein 21B
MAADDIETLGLLNYYMLEGYHRHVQVAVLDATRKFGPDPVLTLYKALSMLAEGLIQESIRELETIKDKQNVDLAAHIVLVNAHGQCRNIDRNVITTCQQKIKDLQSRANDTQTFLSGYILWHLNIPKKAKEAAEILMKSPESNKQGAILKGWIEVTSDRDLAVKKAIRFFDAGLSDNYKDPFGFVGKQRFVITICTYNTDLLDDSRLTLVQGQKF